MRKVLVIGGTGQIGTELLRRSWPADVELHAPPRGDLDLSNAGSISERVASEAWNCVVNCAAFTAVDAAEEQAEKAFLANCQGPAWLAEATAAAGAPLIHLSTDYVFPGDATDPYTESDATGPTGVYGASKASGELAVASANPRSVIIRTAWVLSSHGHNFLMTMLRLGKERDMVRIVSDQHGCPTSAADVASAITAVALRQMEDPGAPAGVYHFVNAGEASWYDLAREIFRLSGELGGPSAEVVPIATAEFPTKARRPANSRLSADKIARDFGIEARDWRAAVADIMNELNISGALKEFAR